MSKYKPQGIKFRRIGVVPWFLGVTARWREIGHIAGRAFAIVIQCRCSCARNDSIIHVS